MTGAKTPILHGVAQGDIDMAGYRLLNVDLSSLASGAPFSDATALIKGSDDATKLARFEIDGFTTGTQRVFTLPNYDAQLATLTGAEAITGKTVLGLRSSLAAFDLRLVSAESLSASRTLTLFVDDADRNVQFGGDVTFADEFTTIGAFPVVLTATGSTALTLPTSGTLATTAQVPAISDVAYNATSWNANLDGASKNAIRDKFESIFQPPFDDDKTILFNNLDATKLLKISLAGLTTGTTRTLTVPNKNGTIACLDDIPDVAGIIFSADEVGRQLSLSGDVSFFGKFTLAGGFDAEFNLSAATSVTFPTEGTLATRAGAETLTNKTLTGPVINAATVLGLRSSVVAFDLRLASDESLGAARTLSIFVDDADRDVQFGGDVSFGSEFTTIGAFPIALTATASTALTLPLSGTVASFIGSKMAIAGTAAIITAGSGSPEGVVAAPVGSVYLRTNGGAGTSIYVKETGAAETGWAGK